MAKRKRRESVAREARNDAAAAASGPDSAADAFPGSARQERLAARGRNRMHFTNLTDLRRAHKKLFEPRGRFTVVHRYVTSADSGVVLLEAALRLPASDSGWRQKVLSTFRQLETDYPAEGWDERGLQVSGDLFCGAPLELTLSAERGRLARGS